MRKLALERKAQFDKGNYTDKRDLAKQIVQIIGELNPSGRFLKRSDEGDGEWRELDMEKSIHKASQVMRDINRSDRRDREERRAKRQKLRETKFQEMREAIVKATKSETSSIAGENVPDGGEDDEAKPPPPSADVKNDPAEETINTETTAVESTQEV